MLNELIGEVLTCSECGQPHGKVVDSPIGLLILCKKCFFELTDENREIVAREE